MNAKKRIAVIDYDKCNPQKCGGWYCESVCPVNRQSKACISHEGQNQPTISEELCIGCLICVKKCPFDAISIINLSTDPGPVVHQFGENQFRIHGMPLPAQNEVVGILGQNGTGKTTILKILAGQLKPNLGNWKIPADWKNVLGQYRGKEAFGFFEPLSQGKLKTAFKPQQVDQLAQKNPKAKMEKVKSLLAAINPTAETNRVIQELGLEKILDRTLDQLSGGELQKVAIAATFLKNADIYFFDEPSSFLDIKERLKSAGFIRKNAGGDKSVMVVEHDLILLDYLCDKLHLVYGTPAVYGQISQVKNIREGINTYLEGYSRDENLRFRDHEIHFFAKSAKESKTTKPLVEFPAMTKKLGNFSLEIKPGKLLRHEVVGILGRNGIGKTTFVKLLAGVHKPDSGELPIGLRVAYKPQYLEAPTEDTVVEELLRKQSQTQDFETLQKTLFSPLGLAKLYSKNVANLSGGELQRLAIALTLSQNADLILLDEPSAYLDAEQRIQISKIIRSQVEQSGKTCLVVDHDLMFIDYISDRLMVFDGKPAEHGTANTPVDMETGMNQLLSQLELTLRRDPQTKRPRINKPGSQLDSEQKKSGKYYYS